MWSNEVGKNRKTDEEHDDDWVEGGFQLVREKFNKYGEGSCRDGLLQYQYLRWIRTENS